MANFVLNRTGQQVSDILDGAYSANGILKSNGLGTITAQTVDSSPTASSTNLVTSGGVASALNGKQNTLSNASLLATYTQTEANLASAVSLKHSHANKSVLDGISSSDVSAWNAKQDALTNTDAQIQTAVADAHTHSNKAILDTIPSSGTTGYVLKKTESGTAWDESVTIAQLFALLPTDTASGSVASFPDGADDVPMESLSVALEPIQDLHGYDHPWVGGAGKNLLDSSTASGTATVWFCEPNGMLFEAGKSYVFSVTASVMPSSIAIYATDKSTQLAYVTGGLVADGLVYTPSVNTYGLPRLYRGAGAGGVTQEMIDGSMIEVGSEKTTWEPYANLCPISGRSSVTAVRDGKNLANIASIKHGDGSARAGNESISLPAGTYTMSANNVGDCSMTIQFWSSSDNMGTKSFDVGQNSNTITVTDDIVRLYCYISTENYNNGKYAELTTIQIETGSSPTAYEPYDGDTYTIQLGQTVYGGTPEVVSGVMTVTHGYLVLNTASMDNNENYPGWKSSGVRALIGGGKNSGVTGAILNVGTAVAANTTSNYDVLYLPKGTYNKTQTEWKALAMDIQIVVPLATPLVIQLTATEISTLLGENTVWSDSGDVAVTYKANIQKYIDKKIAEL